MSKMTKIITLVFPAFMLWTSADLAASEFVRGSIQYQYPNYSPFAASGIFVRICANGTCTEGTYSGANGEFLLTGVPSGDVVLEVYTNGINSQPATFEIHIGNAREEIIPPTVIERR